MTLGKASTCIAVFPPRKYYLNENRNNLCITNSKNRAIRPKFFTLFYKKEPTSKEIWYLLIWFIFSEKIQKLVAFCSFESSVDYLEWERLRGEEIVTFAFWGQRVS